MGLLDDLNIGAALKGAMGEVEPPPCPSPSMRSSPKRSITTSTGWSPRCRRAASIARCNPGSAPAGDLPITEDQLEAVLGNAPVQEFAQHLGLPVDATLKLLAQYLPEIVDKASPNGTLQSK